MEYACIALCHFCDNHGPRVVTCTQTGVNSDELNPAPASPLKLSSGTSDCAISSKQNIPKYPTPTSSLHSSLGSSLEPSCEACRPDAPDDKLGFLSTQNGSVFLSKHLPDCKETQLSLRKACCRSYNSEQTARREGAVVFGDPSSDYVLSYKFYLKDTHARGLRRLYSLVVLSRSPTYLFQFSGCISRQMEVIIAALKEKTDLVYARESAQEGSILLPVRNRHVDPDAVIRARSATIAQSRSLPAITGDSHVFHFLHCRFASLLKTHLPPTLLSLDSSSYLQPLLERHQLQHVLLGKHPSSSPPVAISQESFSSLRHLSRTIGGHIFDQLLYHLYTGHQVVVRGESQSLVSSALRHLSSLLPGHCVRMCEYEKKYQSPDKCNLLGLHPKSSVPSSFFTDPRQSGAVLDIFQPDPHSGSDSENDRDSGVGMGEDPLDLFAFQIQPDTPLHYDSQLLLPTVLTHLHNIIYPNKIYCEDVMRLAIDSTKQSVLTKVMVLKKCTRAPVGKYSSQFAQVMQNKLLSVIHASRADLPFLEFWSLPCESV